MASILGSMLARLTGGSGAAGSAAPGKSEDYRGFTITPMPRQEGSQWLTAGVISKDGDDGVREHSFIRADRHASRDDAAAFAIAKGKQLIDEQGEAIFSRRT